MASTVFNVPGVYLREMSERTAPVLPTGVPAFIGLVSVAVTPPGGVPPIVFGPLPLFRKSDFPNVVVAAFLRDAVNGFFDNGGTYCYVVGVGAVPEDDRAPSALIDALALVAPLSDVDLVAIPDAVALIPPPPPPLPAPPPEHPALRVQRALFQHCTEQRTRVALLDSLAGTSAAATLISEQLAQLGLSIAGPVNAALYHPWIRTIGTNEGFVPPSGHVAGIISRTDELSGVFKAPANVEILGATDLQTDLDSSALALLNDAGVNCLRAFPARGIRIWGARTPSIDPSWRYLNVRRLVLTVMRWIELNMAWAAFEPNVPALWARIQRELGTYLTRLWRAGALQGAAVEQAFFIKCDAEVNPPETREMGQVVTEIGLAPTVPAEFIVVSVQHRAGTTELI